MKFYTIILILFLDIFCNKLWGQNLLQNYEWLSCMEKGSLEKTSTNETYIGNMYDLQYARCKWEVNPTIQYIKGEVTFYFKPTNQYSDVLTFELDEHLTVDSIKRGNWRPVYHQRSGILTVFKTGKFSETDLDSITIWYQGAPVTTNGFGSFMTKDMQGVPSLWTLSEPYGAKDWWPTKQSLNDKIDSIDVFISAPSDYLAVSNGLRISEKVINTQKITHWKHKYPIAAYLIAIAVSNYTFFPISVNTAQHTNVTVDNYIYPYVKETELDGIMHAAKAMYFFTTLFGNYPFEKEKYGHCQFGWGGGMEHQTITFLSGFSFELCVHELAHQWFGDKITCGSWQDIWLNEGFATYLTGMAYEQFIPGLWQRWKNLQVAGITSKPYGSVFCQDTSSVNNIFNGRLSYAKGAYVLHTLRWELGDSLFFKGMYNYINDPNLAYQYATTPDFQQHIEKVSNKDLNLFFKNWVYSEGFPSYQLTWHKDTQKGLIIKLQQTTSHPSVSFFPMKLPIRFYQGTNQRTEIIDINAPFSEFSVGINDFDSIIIDPDKWYIIGKSEIIETKNTNADAFISIFPNPVDTRLNIISLENLEHSKPFELYDLNGRLIFSIYGFEGQKNEVYLPELPIGVYIIKIYTESSIVFKRITILH